jgi:hypothetical protein
MPPLSEALAPSKIYMILEAPRWSDWLPGHVSGRGGRQVGQIGGKIHPTHVYRNEDERWCGLLPGSILIRLVAPPLQPGVGESYLVWGVWSPNRLLLDGTSHI